jgi:hypothetical protein
MTIFLSDSEKCQQEVVFAKPIDVLREYPSDLLVSELYESDEEFSMALRSLFGDAFEYPDFSHRTVGHTVKLGMVKLNKRSHEQAEGIACQKESFVVQQDQTLLGKVMGLTDLHVVVSLGRSAAILSNANLSRIPQHGEEITIAFKDGKGFVSEPVPEKSLQIGR